MAYLETRRMPVFELSQLSIIIPVIFLAMIYQSETLTSQLRMCVYVILSTLAILVKDEAGAKSFFVISITVLLLSLIIILKSNIKKDVSDD